MPIDKYGNWVDNLDNVEDMPNILPSQPGEVVDPYLQAIVDEKVKDSFLIERPTASVDGVTDVYRKNEAILDSNSLLGGLGGLGGFTGDLQGYIAEQLASFGALGSGQQQQPTNFADLQGISTSIKSGVKTNVGSLPGTPLSFQALYPGG